MAKNTVPTTGHQWLQALYRFLETGAWAVLTVGNSSAGYVYTAGKAAWLDVDGTNPPTMGAFRMVDQTTGATHVFTYDNGVLKVDGSAYHDD